MLAFASSFAFFLGSYLYLNEETKSISNVLFVIGLIGIFAHNIRSGLTKTSLNWWPRPIPHIAILYWTASIISAFVNRDEVMAIGATYVFLLFLSSGEAMHSVAAIRNALWAFFAATALVILWSFNDAIPSIGYAYEGMFENPNAMGGVLATTIAILVGLSLQSAGWRRLFIIGTIFLLVVLMATTRSRGSFVTVISCFSVILLVWIRNIRTNRFAFFGLILMVVALSVFLYYAWSFIDLFIYKTVVKSDMAGGISGGRIYLWQDYLGNATLLGGGRWVLEQHDLAAHNTFISLIAQYGWIAGLLFLTLVLALLRHCWINRELLYSNYVPFLSCLSFIVLSATEGMMMKSTMFAMFLFSAAPMQVRSQLKRNPLRGIGNANTAYHHKF